MSDVRDFDDIAAAPGARNDGTRVRHMTEMLLASLIHQHVSDRYERRALTDAVDALPDAYTPALPDDLQAAWAEAEAALPEYALLRVQRVPGWKYYAQEQCEARIEWWAGPDRPVESAYADTPAAACRALAAKLREVGR